VLVGRKIGSFDCFLACRVSQSAGAWSTFLDVQIELAGQDCDPTETYGKGSKSLKYGLLIQMDY